MPDASLDEIVAYLDSVLDPSKYADAEPDSNGLMYRAGAGVSKFAVAVNTTLTTIAGAATMGAQLLLVHHVMWRGIDLHLYDERMAALAAGGVSLYGAHAALDCAPRFGNAFALAELLGVEPEETFAEFAGARAGIVGRCAGSFGDFIKRASRELHVNLEAHEHAKTFGRVAIVPGAGGHTGWLDEARQLGADTYVTGEGSMYTRMFARETGMNLIFGTHHATETPGIKKLGEMLAAETSLPWEFIPDSPDVF
ncbi:MAG TPA: Nif3-like dinuclear metal center hexameric protein [Dehalococcoidia bacterium]|jgi:dinuclear metal center YbgI/SA1388 family protein